MLKPKHNINLTSRPWPKATKAWRLWWSFVLFYFICSDCSKCPRQFHSAKTWNSPFTQPCDVYKSTGWLPVPSYSTPFKSVGNMRWTSAWLYKAPKMTCSDIPKSVPDLEKGWTVKYQMGLTSNYYVHFLQQMVLQHFKIQLHWLFIHPAYLITEKNVWCGDSAQLCRCEITCLLSIISLVHIIWRAELNSWFISHSNWNKRYMKWWCQP